CQLKTGKSLSMFSDTLGQKYFLSDKRHSAGARPPLYKGRSEKFSCCGKVTRRLQSVNAKRALRTKIHRQRPLRSGAGRVADQLAERFADRQHPSQIVGGKIWSRFLNGRGFAADLNDPDDLAF